ncbi:MAG: LuxR C-terminal-related transcriptional regulator [Bacteroidaceae bacterium]|nr:LuxR C-terminal-related transcriptional regulator [Bacteroidaceae bacterium]
MTTKIDDFFLLSNSVANITDSDYESIVPVLNAVKAFAQCTHQCVYVIDYFREGFAYVSDNLAFLCGQPAERIKDFGYQLYIEHVPADELEMLKEINKKGFDLFNEFPITEKMEYSITYDFHLVNGRKSNLISHRITPLVLNKESRIWLALCTVQLSARKKPGRIIMKKEKSKTFYAYDLNKHKWNLEESITLSERERSIIGLSVQGYTMNEIAEKLCKSVDTIKACKRAMFAKMEVSNMTEALSFAINYRLL